MAEAKSATEVVIDLMEKNGCTPAILGSRIGVKNTAVWDRLYNSRKKSDTMKVSTLVQMLQGLDYQLVAVPVGKSLREGEYKLK